MGLTCIMTPIQLNSPQHDQTLQLGSQEAVTEGNGSPGNGLSQLSVRNGKEGKEDWMQGEAS
jgi:hypothetical protein